MQTHPKLVKNLKVGDKVMGADGKPVTITLIGVWGRRTSRFVGFNGRPDGWYPNEAEVEIVEQ